MTIPPPVLALKGLGAAGEQQRPLFRDLWLSLPVGARVGVVGPAGAGKTTLLGILAGDVKEYEGEVERAAGVSVGYLPPDPPLDDAATVAEAVEAGVADLRALLREYDAATAAVASAPTDYSAALERQARLQQALDAAGAWRLDARLAALGDALRLPPGPTPTRTLSPAERRRVALCRLLLQAPDLLLLDEPAAGLDAEVAAWLDRQLAGWRGSVVAVTRDRCFLADVADWILEVDRGAARAWRGGYATWLAQQQGKAVERELGWLRMPPRVRTASARARLQERAGETGGGAVLEAENLIHGSGGRALVGGLSFALPPGAVVGVPGPARCGKTTLLKLLAGEAPPDAGAVRLGPGVRAARVAGTDGGDPPDPAGRLRDLHEEGVNLVLLDEPERGLDIDGLRVLEEALLAFPGAALVATGDRRLLDRAATHILAFEGDSRVVWFPGLYAAYEADRRRRLGRAADQPHRLRFRKLTRG